MRRKKKPKGAWDVVCDRCIERAKRDIARHRGFFICPNCRREPIRSIIKELGIR